MPPPAKSTAPVLLVFGEDEFSVKQRAAQVYREWVGPASDAAPFDHEIIDAAAANSGEVLKVLARLRAALQTLPFFGGTRVVWLQNCNFLGDERAAASQAVTDALAELADELKAFPWSERGGVRLLISAGKVDKRKLFFKTLSKIGTVESFAGWSVDDRNWTDEVEAWAREALRARRKEITDEALEDLTARIGPNARQLDSELEKLSLYTGSRPTIDQADVEAVCARNKAARAFALGDALGDRDLPRLLRRLDEELWEVKSDSRKSEIGLLYGLIAKVRTMLLLKEMMAEGWIRPEADYARFKAQLERVPADRLPSDRRFNPLAQNPYVLYKALPQVKHYSQSELVHAMDLLLACNRRLVSSGLDDALVLQQTMVQMTARTEVPATSAVGGLRGEPGRLPA